MSSMLYITDMDADPCVIPGPQEEAAATVRLSRALRSVQPRPTSRRDPEKAGDSKRENGADTSTSGVLRARTVAGALAVLLATAVRALAATQSAGAAAKPPAAPVWTGR